MYINLVKDKIQKMWIETEFPKYFKKNITHNKNTIVFQEWSQFIIFPSTAFCISKLFFKLTLNSKIMDTLNTQTNKLTRIRARAFDMAE